jgi:hypothetical protein
MPFRAFWGEILQNSEDYNNINTQKIVHFKILNYLILK